MKEIDFKEAVPLIAKELSEFLALNEDLSKELEKVTTMAEWLEILNGNTSLQQEALLKGFISVEEWLMPYLFTFMWVDKAVTSGAMLPDFKQWIREDFYTTFSALCDLGYVDTITVNFNETFTQELVR